MRAIKWAGSLVVGVIMGISAAAAGDGYGPAPQNLIRGGFTTLSFGTRDVNSTDEGGGQTWELSSTSAYNIPLWRSYSMQLDSVSEYYSKANDHVDPLNLNAAGAHFSYRDPNRGLIGIFGGYGETKIRDGHGPSEYGVTIVGGEAQAYVGNLTLYGQAGVGNSSKGASGEGFHDGWFVRGVTRYFLRPDTKLEAEISYAEADPWIDGADKGKFTGWGASLDHKLFNFRSMPVYGTLAYRGAYYDATTENDHATEHVFKAGIKVLFGSGTLLQNDRYGATLDLPTLPFRAAGQTENLD